MSHKHLFELELPVKPYRPDLDGRICRTCREVTSGIIVNGIDIESKHNVPDIRAQETSCKVFAVSLKLRDSLKPRQI